MRFWRKSLEKHTHVDHFSYFLYIFLYLKKNSVNFRKKKIEKNFENNFVKFFIFEKKVGENSVKIRYKKIFTKKKILEKKFHKKNFSKKNFTFEKNRLKFG